jgi:hypothetical protein
MLKGPYHANTLYNVLKRICSVVPMMSDIIPRKGRGICWLGKIYVLIRRWEEAMATSLAQESPVWWADKGLKWTKGLPKNACEAEDGYVHISEARSICSSKTLKPIVALTNSDMHEKREAGGPPFLCRITQLSRRTHCLWEGEPAGVPSILQSISGPNLG